MTVLSKTMIRRDVVHNFGCKFDDLLEQAKREVASAAAAQRALVEAQKKVEELCVAVEKELESGKLEEVANEGLLPLASYIKRWIMRGGGVIDNLATQAHLQKLRGEGAVAAARKVVEMTRKEFEKTTNDLDLIKRAVEAGVADKDPDTGEISVRPQGPGMSAAEDIAQRRAEAKAKKKANGKADTMSEKDGDESKEESSTAEGKPAPKKKRKRRTKKKALEAEVTDQVQGKAPEEPKEE